MERDREGNREHEGEEEKRRGREIREMKGEWEEENTERERVGE